MKKVIVPKPQNDTLTMQLGSLYQAFKGLHAGDKVEFDLSQLQWIYPLLALSLSAYIDETGSSYGNSPILSYLDAIKFPQGIDEITSFQKEIQARKNFIPISVLKREKGASREKLESMFIDLIYKVLESIQGTRNAISYPIAELITNIFEHSKREQGYLFGQLYPGKGYLDICIVDRGRGLAASYDQELGLKLSDGEAINRVMRGNSTKPSQERGYGVRTSKRVVCEGMNGEFILLSGSSALISTQTSEKLVSMPGFYWQGVIVAYRIPKPTRPIEISSYLE